MRTSPVAVTTSLMVLKAPVRRRLQRLYRRVMAKGCVFIRGEASFRDAERLHRVGLITAAVSKVDLLGRGTRPFRELALFPSEAAARAIYPVILQRKP